jgi:hypothetical protein
VVEHHVLAYVEPLDMPTSSTYNVGVSELEDPRGQALAALRAWASNQRPARPELVVAAWRVGARNVAELARAAGVSRDTIYADLAGQGIDYRDRQQPQAVTPRGFAVYAELVDRYGSRVRVQKSSAAEEPCVWISAKSGEEPTSPHLTVEQARRVRDGLDVFLRDAEGDNGRGTGPDRPTQQEQEDA